MLKIMMKILNQVVVTNMSYCIVDKRKKSEGLDAKFRFFGRLKPVNAMTKCKSR